MKDLTRLLNPFLGQLSSAMANNLSIQDNLRANIVTAFFTTKNVNVVVTHGLAAQPIGYIPVRFSAAANIYDGLSLVLGATFANLKSDTTGVTVSLLFF